MGWEWGVERRGDVEGIGGMCRWGRGDWMGWDWVTDLIGRGMSGGTVEGDGVILSIYEALFV